MHRDLYTIATTITVIATIIMMNTNSDGGYAALAPSEMFWVEKYSFLKDRGYLLRPRYRPGWTPPPREAGEREDTIYALVR